MSQVRLLCPAIVFLLLLVAFPNHGTAQSKNQVKEPPIPLVIEPNGPHTHNPDEESITLSVSDFNHIMEREDSLRRQLADQTTRFRSASEKKSRVIFALGILIILTNVLSYSVARKKSSRQP